MTKLDFDAFDTRGYRTVDVRDGYGAWAPTYEATVEDAMDVELLAGLRAVDWAAAREVADLGCGTGRTGAWLAAQGAGAIDGVDLTAQMLERAQARGVFRSLREGDVTATGLDGERYDLVTTSLVDEHLPSVEPLYREAFRLARPGGAYVLVGFHPHFIMRSGMPTHFDAADGESIAITTHVHQLSEHVQAALGAGWALAEMAERVVDDGWLALKPQWQRHRGHPVTFAFVWRRPSP